MAPLPHAAPLSQPIVNEKWLMYHVVQMGNGLRGLRQDHTRRVRPPVAPPGDLDEPCSSISDWMDSCGDTELHSSLKCTRMRSRDGDAHEQCHRYLLTLQPPLSVRPFSHIFISHIGGEGDGGAGLSLEAAVLRTAGSGFWLSPKGRETLRPVGRPEV